MINLRFPRRVLGLFYLTAALGVILYTLYYRQPQYFYDTALGSGRQKDAFDRHSVFPTGSLPTSSSHSFQSPSSLTDAERQENIRRYMKNILDVSFTDTLDNLNKLDNYKDGQKCRTVGWDYPEPVMTKEWLAACLQVNDNEKEILRASHAKFVDSLPSEAPSPDVFDGNGIVIIAGGRLLPVAVVSIRMLRRVAPTIPIEIFLTNRDEYEPDMCENVFDKHLGVKCRVLTDYYPSEFFERFELRQYQLKIMALLASSFDNALMLDSDNFPIQNIDKLFYKEPFASTKYVLWPDFWRRATSPHYYDIAGITVGERVRGNLSDTKDLSSVPYHDLANTMPNFSTESGQILVSKRRYYKSLLLSLYYNVHGYKAYYQLFSQGTSGEGDKETFMAGAVAFGELPYQVQQMVKAFGWREPDGKFHGTGMLQADPVDEHEHLVTKFRSDGPRKLFMHYNMVKLNMRELVEGGEKERLTTGDENRVRYCGTMPTIEPFLDYDDVELKVWQECEWSVCELPQLALFKDWENTNVTYLCETVKSQVDWLKRTHFNLEDKVPV